MIFNSFAYLLVFLPVVVLAYALLERIAGRRVAQAWLLISSLFFYSYAKPQFVVLLLGSIVVNWFLSNTMMRQPTENARLRLLQLGLFCNIAFLCSFKYVNFVIHSLSALNVPIPALPDWDFPLGISFFTLTQIMYLVDTYQEMNKPHSLFDHATFVSMFPYIISGPLVRARLLTPQLHQSPAPEARIEMACRGVFLFSIGLAKKVILADSFARVADAGFGSGQSYSTLEAWIFSIAYSLQIYFDFSGYSDMALGSAWMLGIDIPQNFNGPYRSKTITEFWQRWHISLSNFITNYLFTPLLRSMGKATIRTSVIATIVAMGIAGLWHGPSWNFILFGLLHGVALACAQIWKKRKLKMPDWAGWLLTFVFVNISFIFFRSPNLGAALHMVKSLLPHAPLLDRSALSAVLPSTPTLLVKPVAIGVVLAFFFKTSAELAKEFQPHPVTAGAVLCLVVVCFYFLNSTVAKTFVYFAF